MTEAMQTPKDYAKLCLDFNAGDVQATLREFLRAVQGEPSFKLAPASWIADVTLAIAKGRD